MVSVTLGVLPISIHSLVKRETFTHLKAVHRFNISIHSLVKRETTATISTIHNNLYFNPLPRKEGDVCVLVTNESGKLFQSTPS